MGETTSFTLRAAEASERNDLDGLVQAYLAELAAFSDDLALLKSEFGR